MSNKARNTSGKFASKSETPRKIRSVNLTDDAWQWLADVAAQSGVSRNDYLEAMAEGSVPFMETAISQTSPIMETVESDNAQIAEQPDNNVVPFRETARAELESLRQELEEVKVDRAKLLESSTVVTSKLREEVRELRSQFETERADREEVEIQLSDLRQKSVTASELPEAADLLNQLKGRRKKSRADLADIEVILELFNQSGSSL